MDAIYIQPWDGSVFLWLILIWALAWVLACFWVAITSNSSDDDVIGGGVAVIGFILPFIISGFFSVVQISAYQTWDERHTIRAIEKSQDFSHVVMTTDTDFVGMDSEGEFVSGFLRATDKSDYWKVYINE